MPPKIFSPLGAFLFILQQQYNNAEKHPYVVFGITYQYSNMKSPSSVEKCSFKHCSPELFFRDSHPVRRLLYVLTVDQHLLR